MRTGFHNFIYNNNNYYYYYYYYYCMYHVLSVGMLRAGSQSQHLSTEPTNMQCQGRR